MNLTSQKPVSPSSTAGLDGGALRSASTPGTSGDIPTRERIHALDVVRGVAVSGILFANVLVFFGLMFIPPERLAAIADPSDRVAEFLGHVFVEGKFYSIFSLLFGIGFGLQLQRGADVALPRFRRRLRVLLAIGAVHAVFVWAGDILMLYALLGFSMPWFARKPDRVLLQWAVGLLAVPTMLYIVALLAWLVIGGAPPAEQPGFGLPAEILAIFARVGTGGVLDAFIGNLVFLAGRWVDLVSTMRFPKVLGMFVLGLYAVRLGVALAPSAHRALLTRWCLAGWLVGVPANVIAAWATERWGYLPPTTGGALAVIMQAIGFPMLAIAYATTIALLVVNGNRLMNVFAPMGRMALTNYLMHSVICVVLSYGFGFGLWWRTSSSTAMAIAAAIVLVQLPLSAWWMSRHRFGPVEWVWRRFTYGRAV